MEVVFSVDGADGRHTVNRTISNEHIIEKLQSDRAWFVPVYELHGDTTVQRNVLQDSIHTDNWCSYDSGMDMVLMSINIDEQISMSLLNTKKNKMRLMFIYECEDDAFFVTIPHIHNEEEYFQHSTVQDIPLSLEAVLVIREYMKKCEGVLLGG